MEAAQTFQQESMTQPGIDLAAITDRMEIRKAVQTGNVEGAIERVNDLNPEVSSMPPDAWIRSKMLTVLSSTKRQS